MLGGRVGWRGAIRVVMCGLVGWCGAMLLWCGMENQGWVDEVGMMATAAAMTLLMWVQRMEAQIHFLWLLQQQQQQQQREWHHTVNLRGLKRIAPLLPIGTATAAAAQADD